MKIKTFENKTNLLQVKKKVAKNHSVSQNQVSIVRVENTDLYDEFCNAFDNSQYAKADFVKALEFETSMAHEKGKKVSVVVSQTLELSFDFGYIRIKPNAKGGVELCSMVVYDEHRGTGKGTLLLLTFCGLLYDAMIALVDDNVDFGDVTLTAAAYINGHNFYNQPQKYESPMRQKLAMYNKIGFVVSKMHDAGMIDMTLDIKTFLDYVLSFSK